MKKSAKRVRCERKCGVCERERESGGICVPVCKILGGKGFARLTDNRM